MTDSPIAADRDGIRYLSGVIPAADGGRLVGLARVVSDGHTIAYLQGILVDPGHPRRGIASELLRRIFARFGHVRQHVLLTDTEERQRAFYETHGFRESRDWTRTKARSSSPSTSRDSRNPWVS